MNATPLLVMKMILILYYYMNWWPYLSILVTANQIERLWSRFTSLDKQQKGHLTREDFLRIPELAINPLGDRIVHAFFRDSSNKDEEEGGKFNGANEKEIVNFPDFVRVLAHFRPIKKNAEKNKMNSRTEKLRCKYKSSSYIKWIGLFLKMWVVTNLWNMTKQLFLWAVFIIV